LRSAFRSAGAVSSHIVQQSDVWCWAERRTDAAIASQGPGWPFPPMATATFTEAEDGYVAGDARYVD
jgi:hypothetical protein